MQKSKTYFLMEEIVLFRVLYDYIPLRTIIFRKHITKILSSTKIENRYGAPERPRDILNFTNSYLVAPANVSRIDNLMSSKSFARFG